MEIDCINLSTFLLRKSICYDSSLTIAIPSYLHLLLDRVLGFLILDTFQRILGVHLDNLEYPTILASYNKKYCIGNIAQKHYKAFNFAYSMAFPDKQRCKKYKR